MQTDDTPPEDYIQISEKVRTGEYFREARGMYDLMVNDPMSERYLYVLITALSLLIFLIAFIAVQSLYPLQRAVPFIVNTNDIAEDLPHIKTLIRTEGENPSEAMLRFLVHNYVTLRETYDIDTFDHNVGGVQSQSSPDVFGGFQQYIDPRNPESPITLYQRHAKRDIEILYSRRLFDQEYGMEVIFDALVEDKGEVKRSRWQANIAFQYNGIALDEKSEKVTPVSFIVTQYRTKRLQDVK